MKITEIKTYLMSAGVAGGGWQKRNWLFVKIFTDEGIYGVGEASGWPRVVQTAIHDLTPLLIGEDPFAIEKLWQKLFIAMMGHGMTGVVGGGALSGIEMALWDIKGKALGVPVYELLGGKMRDSIRLYTHAHTPERALELVERGFTGIKTGGVADPLQRVKRIREAVGPQVDLMADVHGPPWLTVPDAIRLGKALEEYDLLFYEDPVAPENIENIAAVARAVNLPIAAGERHATIYGVRELIEREIVDVIQPDTGRAGGLLQMKKMAAMAEAHGITFAPPRRLPGTRGRDGRGPPALHPAQLSDSGTSGRRCAPALRGDAAPAHNRQRRDCRAQRARSGRGHCGRGHRPLPLHRQHLRAEDGRIRLCPGQV